MIRTAEFVSKWHPDKICDRIADRILDDYLRLDPDARVAVEVMGGHGQIHISGEITSTVRIDYDEAVAKILGADHKMKVYVNVAEQSAEIAQGVDAGGAGDQGIMVGYACRDTERFLPLEYDLAQGLCQYLEEFVSPADGKVQVTVDTETKEVLCVVASWCGVNSKDLLEAVKWKIRSKEYLINPAGDWNVGGFDADSGLSGRKLVIDSYGPRVPIGGGSFSGKDGTKVDRSGAYLARQIAVEVLKGDNAKEVQVELAYAIGKNEPVMWTIWRDGHRIVMPTDSPRLRPRNIIRELSLKKPQFERLAEWGHFGWLDTKWG